MVRQYQKRTFYDTYGTLSFEWPAPARMRKRGVIGAEPLREQDPRTERREHVNRDSRAIHSRGRGAHLSAGGGPAEGPGSKWRSQHGGRTSGAGHLSLGGSGIAAPSFRGSEAPKFTPVEKSRRTAWPPPTFCEKAPRTSI